MCLTPPPLRSGSVPAQAFSHGGHGGSAAAPPHTPQQERATRLLNYLREGVCLSKKEFPRGASSS